MRFHVADFRFSGPLDKRLWKKLNRKRRIFAPAAATVAVFVLIETDLNLAGNWRSESDPSYQVTISESSGKIIAFSSRGQQLFQANYSDRRKLDGSIQLFWDDESKARCGFGPISQDLTLTVGQDFMEFQMQYRAGRVSGNSCNKDLAPIFNRRMIRIK